MVNAYNATFSYDTFKVTINSNRKRWVFPKDKYVEYGPEDEWWARKYGFGHEETV